MITKEISSSINEILYLSPNYDDIVNHDFLKEDIFSYKLVDWYKEIIFSCNINIKKQRKLITFLDKSLYLYITNYDYKRKIKEYINAEEINYFEKAKIENLIAKIKSFTFEYEKNKILYFETSRWI